MNCPLTLRALVFFLAVALSTSTDYAHATTPTEENDAHSYFSWRHVGNFLWKKNIITLEGTATVGYARDNDDEVFSITFLCSEQFTEILPPLHMTISWRNDDDIATVTGCFIRGHYRENARYKILFKDLPHVLQGAPPFPMGSKVVHAN